MDESEPGESFELQIGLAENTIPGALIPLSESLINDRYRFVAPFYRTLETLWGGPGFRRCKSLAISGIAHCENVLIAGAGSGEDLLVMTRLLSLSSSGTSIVVLDSSRSMLNRGRRIGNRQSSGQETPIEWLWEDIADHTRWHAYDAIVCHFFLNVFSKEDLGVILEHLSRLLKPAGILLISDFSPLPERSTFRWLQSAYYEIPLRAFVMLTGNAKHSIHDYAILGKDHGFQAEVLGDCRIHGWGPRWLRSWSLTRLNQEFSMESLSEHRFAPTLNSSAIDSLEF